MIPSEEEIEISGYILRRYVFRPAAETPIRGSVFLLHGQGDFAGRYGTFLQPFLREGIVCVATDFPGHGHSEGKRGHIPGIHIVDQIAASNLARCRDLAGSANANIGIIGHSAGGLLALREILKRPSLYRFSWISSPLLRPEAGHNPILICLAGLMAYCWPGFTVSTGVTHDKCSKLPRPDLEERDMNRTHSRISSRWGHTLIQIARELRRTFRTSPPRLPLLVTQGLKDPVCPPVHLHNLLEGLDIPTLTLREFPNALHEPYADDTRDEVLSAIGRWLEQINES